MAFDFNRLADALLGGAARRPRRRARRTSLSPFGSSRSTEARTVRALVSLATLAAEALGGNGRQAPSQTPSQTPAPMRLPRSKAGRVTDVQPSTAPGPWGGAVTPAPARRLPEITPPAAPAARAEQAEALLLIRGMIAAAAADGSLDAEERGAIARQLDAAGLTVAERDLVLADLDRPASPEALAADAADPLLGAQLYAAAAAIAADVTPAERVFLDRLAAALHLAPQTAARIEARLSGEEAP